MKLKPSYIIIALLVGIILLQRACTKTCPEPQITTVHDTIPGDPDTVIFNIPKPVPYKVIVPGETIYLPADTAAILADYNKIAPDYFSNKSFSQVLKDDSSAFVGIDYRLFKNDVFDMKLSFQNRRPIAINTTNVIYPPDRKLKLFTGFGFYGNKEFQGATIDLAMLTKKDHLYTAGYDPFNQYIHFDMYWKFKLKK